jgi:polyhydroxybutyrate depolymerase
MQNTTRALVVSLLLCFCTMACQAGEFLSRGNRLGPGSHTLSLTMDGLERTYIVHVPPSYDSKTRSPLVIMLHGGGGNAKAAMWETGWTEKADNAGFLVVFPNAMALDPSRQSSFARNPQLWNDGSDRFYLGQKDPDDVGFIAAILDDLSFRFSADKRRVFITGFSNGASMSFRVGVELSDRIAAIAPVAGALWFDPPTFKHSVSMCYITGTADPLNLIEGGVRKPATGNWNKVRAKPKPPVRESILKWVRALGCPTVPASTHDANGVHTETYGRVHDDTKVMYIAVDGLGHTWAGGRSLLPESIVGKISNKISATDVIWEFFRKHAMSFHDEKDAR